MPRKPTPPAQLPAPDRSCLFCHCTEHDCSACIERTGVPCRWIAADVCSACEPYLRAFEESVKGTGPSPAIDLAFVAGVRAALSQWTLETIGTPR